MSDDPRERWRVCVVCADCDAAFECAAPSWQVDTIMADGQQHKMFLAGAPLVCPSCRNLKAVPKA